MQEQLLPEEDPEDERPEGEREESIKAVFFNQRGRVTGYRATDGRRLPLAGGGGGRRRAGRGGRGTPQGDEFGRLIRLLERIRRTLNTLTHLQGALPQELHTSLVEGWPDADRSFSATIDTLRDAKPTQRLMRDLGVAGLTGATLRMKEVSINYHMDRVDKAVLTYSAQTTRERVGEWLFKRVKPGFKIMNSFMGSFLKAIPVIEIAKEYKEHVEAGFEVAETMAEERHL
jgi:hypothetical protein